MIHNYLLVNVAWRSSTSPKTVAISDPLPTSDGADILSYSDLASDYMILWYRKNIHRQECLREGWENMSIENVLRMLTKKMFCLKKIGKVSHLMWNSRWSSCSPTAVKQQMIFMFCSTYLVELLGYQVLSFGWKENHSQLLAAAKDKWQLDTENSGQETKEAKKEIMVMDKSIYSRYKLISGLIHS